MVYLLVKKCNSKSLVLEILVKRTKKFTFKFKALTLKIDSDRLLMDESVEQRAFAITMNEIGEMN